MRLVNAGGIVQLYSAETMTNPAASLIFANVSVIHDGAELWSGMKCKGCFNNGASNSAGSEKIRES